jgi:hypothetical protein
MVCTNVKLRCSKIDTMCLHIKGKSWKDRLDLNISLSGQDFPKKTLWSDSVPAMKDLDYNAVDWKHEEYVKGCFDYIPCLKKILLVDWVARNKIERHFINNSGLYKSPYFKRNLKQNYKGISNFKREYKCFLERQKQVLVYPYLPTFMNDLYFNEENQKIELIKIEY